MLKTVDLKLNKFPTVPSSLLLPNGSAMSTIEVDLANLYHHYYIDSRGMGPPDPDPAHFEHVRYLMTCRDFRFQRDGLGINKTFKGNKSNELGQAFCRWFLNRHLQVSHVGHIDDVRDHGALPTYGGISVETDSQMSGDAPDYFCVSSANKLMLAEAKGSLNAVGFNTKKFQSWRNQFKRVVIKDSSGTALKVKGYITAMRWVMEDDSAKIFTTLSAEDPETEGRRPLTTDESRGLVLATKAVHYAASLRRLRQPLMSAALLRGSVIPEELAFQGVVWRCLFPGFDKLRFVGGYFPGVDGNILPIASTSDGKIVHNYHDPFRLDIASGTFVGIEETVFRVLANTARRGPTTITQLERAPQAGGYYSGISYLSDGHIMGPLEFFLPDTTIRL